MFRKKPQIVAPQSERKKAFEAERCYRTNSLISADTEGAVYEIRKLLPYTSEEVVQVSFLLNGPYWYTLEESDVWKSLMGFLKDAQKGLPR